MFNKKPTEAPILLPQYGYLLISLLEICVSGLGNNCNMRAVLPSLRNINLFVVFKLCFYIFYIKTFLKIWVRLYIFCLNFTCHLKAHFSKYNQEGKGSYSEVVYIIDFYNYMYFFSKVEALFDAKVKKPYLSGMK